MKHRIILIFWLLIYPLSIHPEATSTTKLLDKQVDKQVNKTVETIMPIFSVAEQKIIQTLSSRNYDDSQATGNKLSGNPDAIQWGEQLFFDKRLSGDGTMACASCHNPKTAWTKHEAKTNLRTDYQALRHVPHLWNVRYNRWYFWDGRADSLWSQALMPIEDSAEMASSRVQIARLIINTATLKQRYQQLFGNIPARLVNAELPLRAKPSLSNKNNDADQQAWQQLSHPLQADINDLFANIGKTIASFEETIISKDSAFDQFADQLLSYANSQQKALIPTMAKPAAIKNTAISAEAAQGLKLFIGKAGCVNCHSGAHFSDHEFHQSFLEPLNLQGDLGRYNAIDKLRNNPFNTASRFYDLPLKAAARPSANKLTYIYKNVAFRGQFKTPSLRNIADTYPYMHTDEFKTLAEVIAYYTHISERIESIQGNKHQEVVLQSQSLSQREQHYLLEFLHTLTGRSQASILQLTPGCDL